MAVRLGAERATQPANRQPRHFTISNATNSWSVPFHRWYRAMRQATHGGRGRRAYRGRASPTKCTRSIGGECLANDCDSTSGGKRRAVNAVHHARPNHSQLVTAHRMQIGLTQSRLCARHMGRLVALGLFERAEDQTFVPSKELRQVEIERALRLLRQGTAGLLYHPRAC